MMIRHKIITPHQEGCRAVKLVKLGIYEHPWLITSLDTNTDTVRYTCRGCNAKMEIDMHDVLATLEKSDEGKGEITSDDFPMCCSGQVERIRDRTQYTHAGGWPMGQPLTNTWYRCNDCKKRLEPLKKESHDE